MKSLQQLFDSSCLFAYTVPHRITGDVSDVMPMVGEQHAVSKGKLLLLRVVEVWKKNKKTFDY